MSSEPRRLLLEEHVAQLPAIDEADLNAREAAWDEAKETARRQAAWQRFIKMRGRKHENCTLKNFCCRYGEESATDDRARRMLAEHAERRRNVLATVRRYCEDFAAQFKAGVGLSFHGSCGSGKDHLATAVSRVAILGHGKRVVWESGARLYRRLREALHVADDYKRAATGDVIAPLVAADVLYLSDPIPDVEPLTRFQRECLIEIVDQRYNSLRPTIFTLNVLDGQEAETKLPAAVVDRLRDQTIGLSCNWESWRKHHRPTLAAAL